MQRSWIFALFALISVTNAALASKPIVSFNSPLIPIGCQEIADDILLSDLQSSYKKAQMALINRLKRNGAPKIDWSDSHQPFSEKTVEKFKFLTSIFSDPVLGPDARLLYAQIVTRQRTRALINQVLEVVPKLFKNFNRLTQEDQRPFINWYLPPEFPEKTWPPFEIERFLRNEASLDQISLREQNQSSEGLNRSIADLPLFKALNEADDIYQKLQEVQLEFKRMLLSTVPESVNRLPQIKFTRSQSITMFRALPRPDFGASVSHVALVRSWQELGAHLKWVLQEFKATQSATGVIPTLAFSPEVIKESRTYRDQLIAHARNIAGLIKTLKEYETFGIKAVVNTQFLTESLSEDEQEFLGREREHLRTLRMLHVQAAQALERYNGSSQFISTHIPGLSLWEKDMIDSFQSLQKFINAMAELDASTQKQLRLQLDFSDLLEWSVFPKTVDQTE